MPSSPEPALVQIEERRGYAIIRLDRPDKRNAVNRAMRRQLLEIFAALHGKVNACILTGSGNSFCSGVDLKEYQKDVEDRRAADPKTDWASVALAIREHPSIFIAAVNGFALGGGLTLINVCDLAVAANDAQIGMPEMGFATYPTMAGPATQLVAPRKVAAWMILTASRIDGPTAERWNIVNASVAPDRLMATAEEWAQRLAQFDATALSESKKVLDVIPHKISDLRQGFDYAESVNARIERASRAPMEGLDHFSAGKRNSTQG